MDINQIMASLEAKHPGESEYLQAVKEVLLSIQDIYNHTRNLKRHHLSKDWWNRTVSLHLRCLGWMIKARYR